MLRRSSQSFSPFEDWHLRKAHLALIVRLMKSPTVQNVFFDHVKVRKEHRTSFKPTEDYSHFDGNQQRRSRLGKCSSSATFKLFGVVRNKVSLLVLLRQNMWANFLMCVACGCVCVKSTFFSCASRNAPGVPADFAYRHFSCFCFRRNYFSSAYLIVCWPVFRWPTCTVYCGVRTADV